MINCFQSVALCSTNRTAKNLTLGTCWELGRNLIVRYRHKSRAKNKFLWPGIKAR